MNRFVIVSLFILCNSFSMLPAVGNELVESQESILGLKRKFEEYQPPLQQAPIETYKKPRLSLLPEHLEEVVPIGTNIDQLSDAQWEQCKEILPKQLFEKNELSTRKFLETVFKKITTDASWSEYTSTQKQRFDKWQRADRWCDFFHDCSNIPGFDPQLLKLFKVIAVYSENLKKPKEHAPRTKIIRTEVSVEDADSACQSTSNDYEQLTQDQWEKLKPAFPLMATLSAENETKRVLNGILTKFSSGQSWSSFQSECYQKYRAWNNNGLLQKLYQKAEQNPKPLLEKDAQLLALLAKISSEKKPQFDSSSIPQDYETIAKSLVQFVPGRRDVVGRDDQSLENFIKTVLWIIDTNTQWSNVENGNKLCGRFSDWRVKGDWKTIYDNVQSSSLSPELKEIILPLLEKIIDYNKSSH